ncbi:FKBP-type peptidyl-prolyl cis-trans isomerase [Thermaurantiacus sp.]
MSSSLPGPAPSGLAKWIAAALVGVAAMAALAWAGTRSVAEPAALVQGFLAANAKKPGVTRLPSGLQVEVLKPAAGSNMPSQPPGPADFVLVHYEGRLADGTVFDSSYARGEPAAFRVSDVIPGFAEALQQMQPGEKQRITIPPELGYGAEGAGNGVIPPNSVLVFEVELLQVARGG